MVTQRTINDDFHEGGEFSWDVYNATEAVWIPLGRTSGMSFTAGRETRSKSQYIGGRRVTTDRRTIDTTAALSTTMLETMRPLIKKLLLQPIKQTVTQVESVEVDRMSFELSAEGYSLAHEYGRANATTLPTVTLDSLKTAAETGGVTPATYYVWVAPCWGTMPVAGVSCLADKDKTFIIGTPVQASTPIVVAASKKIQIEARLEAAPSAPPDFFLMFVNTSGTLISAGTRLVFNGSNAGTANAASAGGAQVVEGTLLSSVVTYSASNFIKAYAVTDTSTDPWTKTALTLNTDYTDTANGIARVSTSTDLLDDQQIDVYYWYIKPASVETPVGDRTCPNKTYKMRARRYREYDCKAAAADEREHGELWVFEECAITGGTSFNAANPEDYDAGSELSMEVNYNSTIEGFGTVTTSSPALVRYTDPMDI